MKPAGGKARAVTIHGHRGQIRVRSATEARMVGRMVAVVSSSAAWCWQGAASGSQYVPLASTRILWEAVAVVVADGGHRERGLCRVCGPWTQ